MATYLFDFDGTLVDSMYAYSATMLRVLDENEVDYPEDIIKIITPLGYSGAADYFLSLGIKLTKEQMLGKFNEYSSYYYFNEIVTKPDVKETLVELKARGHSLNVLTASPHTVLDPCLERNGVYHLFDNVWSCDDFNTTKSDPEIYRMAASRLNTTVDKVIFLDDNYNADLTAKKAGMQVIGVYDSSSDEFVDEIKSVTDGYIYNFRELL